jgi:hypothetical protein
MAATTAADPVLVPIERISNGTILRDLEEARGMPSATARGRR